MEIVYLLLMIILEKHSRSHWSLVALGYTEGKIFGRVAEVLEEERTFSIKWDLDQSVTHDHKLGTTVQLEPKDTPLQQFDPSTTGEVMSITSPSYFINSINTQIYLPVGTSTIMLALIILSTH